MFISANVIIFIVSFQSFLSLQKSSAIILCEATLNPHLLRTTFHTSILILEFKPWACKVGPEIRVSLCNYNFRLCNAFAMNVTRGDDTVLSDLSFPLFLFECFF